MGSPGILCPPLYSAVYTADSQVGPLRADLLTLVLLPLRIQAASHGGGCRANTSEAGL